MVSMNPAALPYPGRPKAKLDAMLFEDLRPCEGHGDIIWTFDEGVPHLHISNEAGDDWLKFAMIDVTEDVPDDGDVLTWDTSASKPGFEAPSGGGGGGGDITYGKMTKSGDTVIATGSGLQPVSFDTVDFDTADVFDFNIAYSDNVFEAPATGVYQHTINLALSADAANRVVTLQILDDTAGIYAQAKYLVGTTETSISLVALTNIAVGKIVQIYVSVSAGTVTVSGFTYGEWSVLKLS